MAPYFTKYRRAMLLLLFITAVDSAATVINPVLLGFIVDDGILRHRVDVVVALSWPSPGSRVYELRTSVFRHVQRQPLAVSTLMTLGLVLAAMFYLSWQSTLVALAIIPLFGYVGKVAGSRQQRLTREQMQLGAELATMTSERSNVSGALLRLVPLSGRQRDIAPVARAGHAGRAGA